MHTKRNIPTNFGGLGKEQLGPPFLAPHQDMISSDKLEKVLSKYFLFSHIMRLRYLLNV